MPAIPKVSSTSATVQTRWLANAPMIVSTFDQWVTNPGWVSAQSGYINLK
jgi:hypothetical protein